MARGRNHGRRAGALGIRDGNDFPRRDVRAHPAGYSDFRPLTGALPDENDSHLEAPIIPYPEHFVNTYMPRYTLPMNLLEYRHEENQPNRCDEALQGSMPRPVPACE